MEFYALVLAVGATMSTGGNVVRTIGIVMVAAAIVGVLRMPA